MPDDTSNIALPPEVARRRTFAIISHPDAGKTTPPRQPLFIGTKGNHPVIEGVPDQPFSGDIRRLTIQRPTLEQAAR